MNTENSTQKILKPMNSTQKATVAHEKKAFFVLFFILSLCCTGPILIISKENPSYLSAFAPSFVWIFNFWLFGYSKMMIGGLALTSQPLNKPENKATLDKMLMGIGYKSGLEDPFSASLSFHRAGQPKASLILESETGEMITEFDEKDLEAITTCYVGDNSIWSLVMSASYTEKLFPNKASKHELFEGMANLTRFEQGDEPETFVRKLTKILPKGKDFMMQPFY